ncbi:stage II sporulation protein P [Clostridium sp. UBA5119]|uniref:stage II sporulation protein P n=1 Tax=Clostridium sp. UBA5119 TaxID=1946366 RepID=UPI003217D906
MNNKSKTNAGKYCSRAILAIIAVVMVISIGLSRSTQALDDDNLESINRTNFFMKLIGQSVTALKPAVNKDDTKFIGNFTLNPLDIVRKEISFLDEENLRDKTALENVKEHAKVVQKITINPFELKDTDINKFQEGVDVVGDPKDNSKKKILIYHTHTNEAYAEGNRGLPTTVAGVGDALTSELEKLGFTVVHDKTIHDKADYNRAYHASRETIGKNISSYGEFDLIIDLHRDGGPRKEDVTGNIKGEDVAKLTLVTTMQDPKYPKHIENVKSIVAIANKLYPGLYRDRSIIAYDHGGILFYNQDLSDNAILMEVGADTNKLQEAKNSMKYMSIVFAQHLNSK